MENVLSQRKINLAIMRDMAAERAFLPKREWDSIQQALEQVRKSKTSHDSFTTMDAISLNISKVFFSCLA